MIMYFMAWPFRPGALSRALGLWSEPAPHSGHLTHDFPLPATRGTAGRGPPIRRPARATPSC